MLKDPRTLYPQPPYPGKQQQAAPALSSQMDPQPDCGEESYVGRNALSGRVALITGADSGIGRAVAIAFAREGADIALSYLPEEQGDAELTARWVTKAGRRALLLPGDLQSETHCQELVAQTVEQLGSLDILINNASTEVVNKVITDVTAEQLERSFRTNVFAMFHLAIAAVPHMKPGAAIVNTTSVQSKAGMKSALVYASTKGAIATFTIALSNLLAPEGIRVNCVAPGPIWTPIQPATKTPEELAELGKVAPLARAGQPAELAPAYVLLASDAGSYMTGALVPVTGGTPMF